MLSSQPFCPPIHHLNTQTEGLTVQEDTKPIAGLQRTPFLCMSSSQVWRIHNRKILNTSTSRKMRLSEWHQIMDFWDFGVIRIIPWQSTLEFHSTVSSGQEHWGKIGNMWLVTIVHFPCWIPLAVEQGCTVTCCLQWTTRNSGQKKQDIVLNSGESVCTVF